MTAIHALPADAQEIISDQGWDNDTIILHLLAVMERHGLPDDKIGPAFREFADEENAEAAALDPDPRYVTGDPENAVIECRFTPQAWVRDQAMEVDPEGATTWFMTMHEVEDLCGASSLDDLEDDTHDTDALRGSIHAPQWVKDWSGPFYVSVDTVGEEEPA